MKGLVTIINKPLANMSTDKPKVSVIIPAYNCQLLVPITIQSVLAQTLTEFELIIINDGSTDGTLDAILSAAKDDNRVRVISIKNGGPAKARNIGINSAEGEYLLFIDSDDTIDSAMLFEMYKLAQINKLDVCACGYNMVREKNGSEAKKLFLFNDFVATNKELYHEQLMPMIKSHLMYVVWNKLFRREFIMENHLLFTDFLSGEDRLFNIQSFRFIERFGFVNKPLYNYYVRSQSLNSKYISNRFESALKAHLDLMVAYKSMGIYSQKNQDYINFIFVKGIMSCFCQLASHACPLTHSKKLDYIKSTLQMTWVKEAIANSDDEFSYSRHINRILRTGNAALIYACAKAIYVMQSRFSGLYTKIKHNKR